MGSLKTEPDSCSKGPLSAESSAGHKEGMCAVDAGWGALLGAALRALPLGWGSPDLFRRLVGWSVRLVHGARGTATWELAHQAVCELLCALCGGDEQQVEAITPGWQVEWMSRNALRVVGHAKTWGAMDPVLAGVLADSRRSALADKASTDAASSTGTRSDRSDGTFDAGVRLPGSRKTLLAVRFC